MNFDHDMYEEEMEYEEYQLKKYERRNFINVLEIGAIVGMMISAIWLCLESVKILSQAVK